MATSVQRVALLCLDPWRVEGSHDHRPFNYAVRRIQAAIVADPRLSHLELELIESSSLEVEELLARIEAFDPDVIGASAYVWSFPTLLEACRRARRARPDRVIVFGGPSARPEMFELPQHRGGARVVDAVVVGEGEECMQDILLAPDRSRQTLATIPGLAVHDGARWVNSPSRRYAPLDSLPSPYQLGLMPQGVTGQIESFRGCPLSCTYCEWGDTGATPRTFGVEHLVRELQALRGLNAKGTWLVDPGLNLNNRAFRNLRQAESEVGALKALGNFRCEIYPSHLTDEHLRFLEDTRTTYTGIGLQSFDVEVLKGVERPFSESRFNRVVSEVASIVPDATVEIILGLPGDNPDNFRRTVEKVRKLPVSVRVFHCLVLPSALMTRASASFQLKFDPFTLQMISCLGWSREALEETCQWLDAFAHNEGEEIPHGGTWKFQRPGVSRDRVNEMRPRAPEVRSRPTIPPEMRDVLSRRVAQASSSLQDVMALGRDLRDGMRLMLRVADGDVVLRVTPAVAGERSFRTHRGVSYSYEVGDSSPDAQTLRLIEQVMDAIHPIAEAVVLGIDVAPERVGLGLPTLGKAVTS